MTSQVESQLDRPRLWHSSGPLQSGKVVYTSRPIILSGPEEMPQLVPSRKRDEDSGRFEEEYSPEEVIAAIQKHDGQAGTSDIAEEIGSSYGAARYKLRVMEEEGYLKSRQISGVYIWEVAENDKQEN